MADITRDELEAALVVVEQFLANRAVTPTDAANFKGSAARVTKMYHEMAWTSTEIADAVRDILNVTFPVDGNEEAGMITQGPIVLNSMCPHHFMPVRYHAYVGYLPSVDGKVLGLSKLARIPEYLSKRFVLQEQLAKDIADALHDPSQMTLFQDDSDILFESEGSIVTLVGHHTCEACRGVQQDARTMVTERRGAFQESTLESRFYQSMNILRSERPFGG